MLRLNKFGFNLDGTQVLPSLFHITRMTMLLPAGPLLLCSRFLVRVGLCDVPTEIVECSESITTNWAWEGFCWLVLLPTVLLLLCSLLHEQMIVLWELSYRR